ncbi:MAG: DUF1573 domain-containing protein [Bacteroidota bacterium]
MLRIFSILACALLFSTLTAQPQFYDSGLASIDFVQETYDFGEIEEGEIVTHEFEFINRGSRPLVISDARGSCGCTVPTWSQEPVEPGKRGSIVVQFNSTGKRGERNQKVTITANTDPEQTFIFLRGLVNSIDAEVSSDQNYQLVAKNEKPITSIEFEEEQFDFGEIPEGEVVTHVFAFTNTGEEPLIITDARGSCGCTVPSKPTAPIMPGETASITVQFNSRGKRGDRNQKVTITSNTDPAQTFVYLKGYVVPQSESDTYDFEPITEEAETALSAECFALFPNPTTDYLRLQVETEAEGKSANIAIYSKMGQLMAEREVQSIVGNIEFEVGHYPAGEYIAYVRIGDSEPEARCFVVVD